MWRYLLFFGLLGLIWFSGSYFVDREDTGYVEVPPSPQREGNPAAGYRYLLYGDVLRAGVPLALFKSLLSENADDIGREGDAQGLPYPFNAVEAPNGVKVAAPTCLTCHAERLNGRLIVGLGNNTADYTRTVPTLLFDRAVEMRYGKDSPEWAAYWPLSRSQRAIGPYIRTAVRGLNPADKIFAALAAHRRAEDLMWLDSAQFALPVEVVPTDVPPWWLLKKKNALYYNALGRGDFARLSSASVMLTLTDSAEARRVDRHMVDVIAWIRTLEPPKYPFTIDTALAERGKVIFEKNCSKCHGTYGSNPTYPNRVVELKRIGTDPLLAQMYRRYPEYHTWYNRSWFAQGPHKAELRPTDGYIAPPLDGIWASAPYLHNGSVPTVEDLLNSAQRPKYWRRSFDNSDYDPVRLGWRYRAEEQPSGPDTYDTTLPGYGNGGHTFGDHLSAEERKAVIEYLKTL
jgi:mono/diheme cytochrome c family protein